MPRMVFTRAAREELIEVRRRAAECVRRRGARGQRLADRVVRLVRRQELRQTGCQGGDERGIAQVPAHTQKNGG